MTLNPKEPEGIAALKRLIATADVAREGAEVAMSKSPDEFASFLVDDNRFWAQLVKESGVKAE